MATTEQSWINDSGTVVVTDNDADAARYLAAGYRALDDDEDYPIQQHEIDALPDDHPLKTGGVPATAATAPGGVPPKARTAKQLGI